MSCGSAEVGLDEPAQLGSRTACSSVSAACAARAGSTSSSCSPSGRGSTSTLLGGDRPCDHLAVAHGVEVGVDETGHQRLAETEARLDRGDLRLEVTGSAVNRRPGRRAGDHLLHDDGHLDATVIDAVAHPVGHRPLGEQRGPAAADVREDRGGTRRRQVGVVRPGEGAGRPVLVRRARTDRVAELLAWRASAPVIAAVSSTGTATCSTSCRTSALRRADAFAVAGSSLKARRSAPRSTEHSRGVPRKACVVTQNPGGISIPRTRESSPRRAPLPPASASCPPVDLGQL